MLIDTSVPELRVRWSTALGLAIPFALITSFLLSMAVRARRNKVVTGLEGMIGQRGITVGELSPDGTVLVHGEYWKAHAPEQVPASEPVRVTGIKGLTLRVEHVKENWMESVPVLLVVIVVVILPVVVDKDSG